ncbi:hypothetical protein DY000_02037874 [Brassica cretica]|uniref:Reverse transcriptase domain-containing protein n=1 Tax=Brassica cretica TaxID=69181 RepID=A0ABQ7BFN6_BRACR|nr:hypothetical protein DY000_02037874 [Brassica cretica]
MGKGKAVSRYGVEGLVVLELLGSPVRGQRWVLKEADMIKTFVDLNILASIDELPKWRHTQSLYFINFKSVYDSLKCTRFVVPSHSDSHRFITLSKAFLR